jgi:hypothetical protein
VEESLPNTHKPALGSIPNTISTPPNSPVYSEIGIIVKIHGDPKTNPMKAKV